MQLLMALYIVLFLTAVLYSTANARGIPNQAEFVIPQDEDQQMQTTKIKGMIQCWRQLNDQERVDFKNFVDCTSAQDQKVENGDQASTIHQAIMFINQLIFIPTTATCITILRCTGVLTKPLTPMTTG